VDYSEVQECTKGLSWCSLSKKSSCINFDLTHKN